MVQAQHLIFDSMIDYCLFQKIKLLENDEVNHLTIILTQFASFFCFYVVFSFGPSIFYSVRDPIPMISFTLVIGMFVCWKLIYFTLHYKTNK